MSNRLEQDPELPLELLAGSLLGDLSPDELATLKELESADSESYRHEIQELELTAAALQLHFLNSSSVPMPEGLRRSILAKGNSMVRPPDSTPRTELKRELVTGSSLSRREVLAWLTCAASLMLSLSLWLFNRGPIQMSVALEKARDSLIEQAADLVRADWKEGKTPFDSAVKGDVVWSNLRQSGFMRFVGLPKNDSSKEQYQLWIIDPGRDDEPIDGGVFDVDVDGVAIVPIRAKLQVLKPTAFAITVEKPGGVVVSTQERLPLLALLP